jgi:hypothetical protein
VTPGAFPTGRLAKDPGSIVFHRAGTTGPDRLQVNGLIRPPEPIDPTVMEVGVRLTKKDENNNDVEIYSALLPAGSLQPKGRKLKYSNRDAKTNGGFALFQYAPHRTDGFRIRLITYGDLSGATVPDMTIDVLIGTGEYQHSASWTQTRRGWREIDHSD